MAVTIAGTLAIKRRAIGGASGAPSSLRSGEMAHNEQDNTVYIGVGDNGQGEATSILAIAGSGTFATKDWVGSQLENTGAGDMLKSVYDTNDDGIVDKADQANKVPWGGIQNVPAAFPPETHSHNDATDQVSGFMSAADKIKLAGISTNANFYVHPTTDGNRHVPATGAGDVGKFLKSNASAGGLPSWAVLSKGDVGLSEVDNTPDSAKPISTAQAAALALKAPLNSPTLTGTPTAPTAAQTVNNTQIATTAYVKKAIADLLNGAPEALDTLIELAEAIGNDPNFSATVTGMIAAKLDKNENLSDLTDAAAARANLGLGSMATQAANAVNISGGSISNVSFDGGTY